ncbi:MAG: tetratricopeptide repeat protein [Bacteroidales bacterium]|nr:tetratricopeptide repeat protein [Bacteroidales bacterium]
MYKILLLLSVFFVSFSISIEAQKVYSDSVSSHTNYEGQDLEVVLQLVKKFQETDLEKALELSRNGVFMASELHNLELQLNFLIEEAFCLKRLNIYDQAISLLFEADELAGKLNDSILQAWVHLNISDVYYDYELYDKSLFYDFKALELCKSDESLIKARILENIGRDYNEQGNYTLAINYLKKSIRIHKLMDNHNALGKTYFIQSKVYRNIKDLQKASKLLYEALMMARSNHEQFLETEISLEMANSFLAQDERDSAGVYLNKTLNLAQNLNHSLLLKKVYFEKFNFFQVQNKIDSALYCHLQYLKYKDEVFSRGRDDRISEMEVKYQTESQEKRNAELQEQVQAEKLRRKFLIGGIILVIVLGALLALYVRYRAKVKMGNTLIQLNKDLEHRVEERTEELKIAKIKAEESAQLKSAFLANLSHEIRTPMNAILGFSPFLNDLTLPEEERSEYVKLIKSNGEKLMKIINDIVDLSKLTTHQLSVDIDEFTADMIIDESRAYFEAECYKQEKKLELKVNRPLDIETVKFSTDIYRLRQITNHLVNNAIKFTHQGYVEVGCSYTSEMIEFYVKDSGIGISLEKQKVIFETFTQVDNSHTRVHGGTGVGLTLVQKLVEVLGGKLDLQSTLNEGTTVTISIPREFLGDQELIRTHEVLLN